jgi:hypothetical protein
MDVYGENTGRLTILEIVQKGVFENPEKTSLRGSAGAYWIGEYRAHWEGSCLNKVNTEVFCVRASPFYYVTNVYKGEALPVHFYR